MKQLSQLVKCLWYSCKLLPFFGEDKTEVPFMDAGSIVFSFIPNESFINCLKLFSKDLDLNEVDKAHELNKKGNMAVTGKMKLEHLQELILMKPYFEKVNLKLIENDRIQLKQSPKECNHIMFIYQKLIKTD